MSMESYAVASAECYQPQGIVLNLVATTNRKQHNGITQINNTLLLTTQVQQIVEYSFLFIL